VLAVPEWKPVSPLRVLKWYSQPPLSACVTSTHPPIHPSTRPPTRTHAQTRTHGSCTDSRTHTRIYIHARAPTRVRAAAGGRARTASSSPYVTPAFSVSHAADAPSGVRHVCDRCATLYDTCATCDTCMTDVRHVCDRCATGVQTQDTCPTDVRQVCDRCATRVRPRVAAVATSLRALRQPLREPRARLLDARRERRARRTDCRAAQAKRPA
jgi:hypothetical protein